MNYVISIIKPNLLDRLFEISERMELPLSLELHGHGTATKSMRDLLGLEFNEKRVVITVCDEKKTEEYIKAQRLHLYIDAPGNGIVCAVPIKSVGGGRTLAYLGGDKEQKVAPKIDYRYELILAIANEGCTDIVMDAARASGARGGTVLHGKGTGAKNAENFFKVNIASEKEMIVIVAPTEQKSEIMRSVIQSAGPGTEAGAIVFSLPVTEVAGFNFIEEERDK
ncbi:MAG: P-II family nitrogen regulator [Ruminococcaceae bacterium]|nr:P-II family nitrogen regulator [Oscillospiraceae bacterium]